MNLPARFRYFCKGRKKAARRKFLFQERFGGFICNPLFLRKCFTFAIIINVFMIIVTAEIK
jgi:hypothetical protein